MDYEKILIAGIITVGVIILLIIIAGVAKAGKKKRIKIEDSPVVESAQISTNENLAEASVPSMKVVIAQGESIVVGSEGRIPCGEYTMESSDGEEKFNVRIGRYVKEYENGCTVVLTEKQKVTAVSTTIILR